MFKVKYTSSDLINQFKAYLIAYKFTQIEDVNFNKTFTSTL